jgi:hypothetical protein
MGAVCGCKGCGMWCIAIKNPYTPAQDLFRADLVLDSLENMNETILARISE